jgi:hypothetical protein
MSNTRKFTQDFQIQVDNTEPTIRTVNTINKHAQNHGENIGLNNEHVIGELKPGGVKQRQHKWKMKVDRRWLEGR